MLFTAADEFSDFNLAQHFDVEKEPDVRLRMHGLYERTKETVARERFITLEVALLVGLLESQPNLTITLKLECWHLPRHPHAEGRRGSVANFDSGLGPRLFLEWH